MQQDYYEKKLREFLKRIRWQYIMIEAEIHLMEFNEGITTVDLRDTIYRLFIDIYNNCPNYRSTFEFFTKVGLRLKEDMPFEING